MQFEENLLSKVLCYDDTLIEKYFRKHEKTTMELISGREPILLIFT